MELRSRKIKKVIDETMMYEPSHIQYNVGDIIKYQVKVDDKYMINYGKLIEIINQDLYKVSIINSNHIENVKYSDVIKSIDELLYYDNTSSIYYLLLAFLFLQLFGIVCYYLYTYESKSFIILGQLIINNIKYLLKMFQLY